MKRSAFTLVELLIAVAIISVLIALLTPAISSVRDRARTAEVRMEISQIEGAIAAFQHTFRELPPSQIHLYEDPNGWTGDSKERAKIRGIWGKFDFTQPRDFNMDGDSNDVFILKGDQALVFFLGGIYDASRGFTGFSSNPTRPFGFRTDSGGNVVRDISPTPVGPFFEFDQSRILSKFGVDYNYFNSGVMEGDCSEWFPVYADPIQGQTRPYIYTAAYGGLQYHDSTSDLSSDANTYPATQETPTGFRAYRRQGGALWKPKSYQIISPGFDSMYGIGGLYYSDGNNRLPEPDPTNPVRHSERDNITNFVSGTLNP